MQILNLTEHSDQDRLSGSRRTARLCMATASDHQTHSGHTKAKAMLASLLLVAALLFIALPDAWAVPDGTEIINTALASYDVGTTGQTTPSNTVITVTTIVRTPSIVEFLRYVPEHPDARNFNVAVTDLSTTGNDTGPFVPLPPPVPFGGTVPVDLNSPVPLITAEAYHIGEPFFLCLTDLDQNFNNLARETILLSLTISDTADSELIRLTETGPDTGVFAGYIQSGNGTGAIPNNGIATITIESNIKADYIDIVDGSDTSADAVIIDPFGIIFDSNTGLPVDDALVTIIDTGTGLPADVFCEDGTTPYPSEVTSGDGVIGVCAIDYDFPAGGYRFPALSAGNYRIVVTPPAGYAFPSSVPTPVLQSLPGEPFTIVNGSREEAFALVPGPALEIDIPLDPSSSGLWLTKSASKNVVAIGEFLQYSLELENLTSSPILDVDITDRLPVGFRYQKGSLKIDGEDAPDPEISSNGKRLIIPVGNIPTATIVTVTYVVEIASGAKYGSSTNVAVASSASGFTSNTARSTVVVKDDLFRNKSFIIGRVIADNCEDEPVDENAGVSGIRIYLEDGTYALTDVEGKYHFEGVEPGVHVVQLDIESVPDNYRVVPCEENTRYAGRSFSQFVDLQGGTMWRADFHLALKPETEFVELNITAEKNKAWHELKNTKDRSGERTVETNEKAPYESAERDPARERVQDNKTMPIFDWMWLNNAEPGLAFVWPSEGSYPPIPSMKIAVKHDPGKELTLLLNGKEVDPLYLDGSTERRDKLVAVSLWIGVQIEDGDNLFEAVEYNQDGTESRRISRNIHYSGPPVMAKLVPERSRLIADGLMPAVIAVRLTDKSGHPAREGVVGEYSVDPPYASLSKIDELRENPLMMLNGERSNYLIGDDGVALIELMPTSQTGEVSLRFSLVDGENVVKTWLSPEDREWILVGLAEGTIGYNTVSGNMENLNDSDIKDELYEDGSIAFFAKGTIKGKWLLTLAYDSEKERDETSGSLFGTIDPDTYYTLYGDATDQQYDGTSAEKLYIKLERDQFYALFGDYNTGLNVTELSRYNRSFTGLKTELQTDKYSLNLFAAETNQAFIKDEIRGDGTSGLYYLSRADIVLNSEKITIETRDRFRSEIILETRTLSRHIDYNIDYDTGSIFFREPVFSKDRDMNQVFIIIDYELNDPDAGNEYIYGGRGAVRFLNNMLETGATYIHEGGTGTEGDLYGADVTIDITDKTTIKAEYSSTNKKDADEDISGDAYLAEIRHDSEKLDGTLYYKEQDEGFGLEQQNDAEGGTRKYGAEASYSFNDNLSIHGLAYRQQDLSSETERDVGEAGAEYTAETYSLRGGLRHIEDTLDDGTSNSTLQATAGASKTLLNGRLILRADREQSLGGDNENSDFPTRTILGTDYILNNYVSLFGEHEFANGEEIETQNSRAGIRAIPWDGGTTTSSVTRQYNKDGTRVFATMGLSQAWQYNKWSFNGGFDHSRTVKRSASESIPSFLGIADNDFTAFTLGATYQEEKWTWDWRGEARYSDLEDKYGLHTGIYGEVRKGLGMSASLHLFTTESDSGTDTIDANLRLGLAYRPRNTEWIMLDRLDFYYLEQSGPALNNESWKIVNNMNANYKPNIENQLSLHYGAKYVKDTFGGTSYSGFTDLIGIEARHDITKRWDVGARGNLLHSWNSNQYDYSAGLSVGCNLITNAWISLGYNFAGFVDNDFSSAKYTAQGAFIQFRMKFDQYSIKDIVKKNSEIR